MISYGKFKLVGQTLLENFVNSKSDYNPQRTWLTIDKFNPINYSTFVRRIFIRLFLSFDITNIL